jgi:hypothetical protein
MNGCDTNVISFLKGENGGECFSRWGTIDRRADEVEEDTAWEALGAWANAVLPRGMHTLLRGTSS